MKAPLTIRAEVTDLADWERQASEARLNISEWIRRKCNGGAIHSAEDNSAQDLPRVGNVPAPERRAGVAQSVSASRSSRKKEREIKLCRHNLADCTICGVSA